MFPKFRCLRQIGTVFLTDLNHMHIALHTQDGIFKANTESDKGGC